MKLKYRKKPTKQGRVLEGGEQFSWLAIKYIPGTPGARLSRQQTKSLGVRNVKFSFSARRTLYVTISNLCRRTPR